MFRGYGQGTTYPIILHPLRNRQTYGTILMDDTEQVKATLRAVRDHIESRSLPPQQQKREGLALRDWIVIGITTAAFLGCIYVLVTRH